MTLALDPPIDAGPVRMQALCVTSRHLGATHQGIYGRISKRPVALRIARGDQVEWLDLLGRPLPPDLAARVEQITETGPRPSGPRSGAPPNAPL